MLNLRKIAVTGGVASGKSSVCQIFKELGAFVISADEIVHNLLSKDTPLIQQIADTLGKEIICNDKVDRKIIAEKVFTNSKLLHKLEKLLHPAVKKEMNRSYNLVAKQQTHSLFVAEIPLFFETELPDTSFDTVIVVDAPTELRKKRSSFPDFMAREARLLPIEEKKKKAHFVIHNELGLDELRNQVKNIYYQLESKTL